MEKSCYVVYRETQETQPQKFSSPPPSLLMLQNLIHTKYHIMWTIYKYYDQDPLLLSSKQCW